MIKTDSPIKTVGGIGTKIFTKLNKLGVKTIGDLINHFPHRYEDFSNIKEIAGLVAEEKATITAKITGIKNIRTWKKRIMITETMVEDNTGLIRAVWFNQPYLIQSLKKELWINLSGKVSLDNSGLYFSNPIFEVIGTEPNQGKSMIHTGGLVPVYPETRGLSSRWLRYKIRAALDQIKYFEEFLPDFILNQFGLAERDAVLRQIHFPGSGKEAEIARRRLSFEELFLLQLFGALERKKIKSLPAPAIPTNLNLIKKFVENLPFKLTDSQRLAAWQILKDMEAARPMNRLLEGDVGSGKTAVAAIAALNLTDADWQAAYLAPTEILAQQHFKTFKELFKNFHQEVALVTGSESQLMDHGPVPKKTALSMIANGEIKIVIGTHALIQKEVRFSKLGLVIVDEQHRFGVDQRAALLRRTNAETSQNERRSDEFLYKDLTYKIRGVIFEVKSSLGAGHKESIYQKALEEEFKKAGLSFNKEKPIPIIYEGKKIGSYRPDFILEDKIIIELKTLPFVGAREKRQLWTYLKGSEYKIALLVNFGPGLTIDRIIYDSARKNSAYSLHSSAYVPHLLSMTATPIPRTLALTMYGDLDISLIKELPAGRKKIITKIVAPSNRLRAYDFIRKEIESGRQVFVICPLIEDSPKLEVRSVTAEYEKLKQNIFPDLEIAVLHGRMKPQEKEEIMKKFKAGEINLLVSTAVIEVGIDVPNASVMMIEGAERFGFAQLHQFRGRVGRAEHQSYCFLFTDSAAKATQHRLKALVELEDGFALAEKDLEIRGPGEFFGTQQSGLPDLAMASLKDVRLIEEVQSAVKLFLERDSLENNPALKAKLAQFRKSVHWE